MTPYEILTGHKPNVTYIKVFGCKCYILKKGTRLSKFNSKTDEGIFVGYSSDSHAYRVYNKTTGRVVETSNVTFEEDDVSRGRQSVACDAGVAIPPDTIGRMGIGFFRPIEGHLMEEGEGPSSASAEPSPSQVHDADQGPSDRGQEQAEDPQPGVEGASSAPEIPAPGPEIPAEADIPATDTRDSSPSQNQDQHIHHEDEAEPDA